MREQRDPSEARFRNFALACSKLVFSSSCRESRHPIALRLSFPRHGRDQHTTRSRYRAKERREKEAVKGASVVRFLFSFFACSLALPNFDQRTLPSRKTSRLLLKSLCSLSFSFFSLTRTRTGVRERELSSAPSSPSSSRYPERKKEKEKEEGEKKIVTSDHLLGLLFEIRRKNPHSLFFPSLS